MNTIFLKLSIILLKYFLRTRTILVYDFPELVPLSREYLVEVFVGFMGPTFCYKVILYLWHKFCGKEKNFFLHFITSVTYRVYNTNCKIWDLY